MTDFRHQQIAIDELRNRLHQGIVNFAFEKLDGSLRLVKGTLNLNQIPATHHPNGNGSPTNKALRFYDFNAGGWRSLRIGANVYLLD
ncbi:MAG: SH3 beta-barrel fold-containing protein [Bacilli bacterium]